MQILFDNLLATLVGAALILILVASNVRHRRVSTEATAFYAATAQTENFLQILRRDLQGITEIHTPTEDAASKTYSFDARIGTDTTLHTIAYKREFVKTKGSKDVYRIRRYLDGVEQGGSGDIVTGWNIATLNEQGQLITGTSSLGNARQIRLHLETTSPLGTMTLDKGLSWESTFFPPLLDPTQLN